MSMIVIMNGTFNSSYTDSSSSSYIMTKYDLDQLLNTAYTGCPGFLSAEIDNFGPGSIVAYYTASYTGEQMATDSSSIIDFIVTVAGPKLSGKNVIDNTFIYNNITDIMEQNATANVEMFNSDPCKYLTDSVCSNCRYCQSNQPVNQQSNQSCVSRCNDQKEVCASDSTTCTCNSDNVFFAGSCVSRDLLLGLSISISLLILILIIIILVIIFFKLRSRKKTSIEAVTKDEEEEGDNISNVSITELDEEEVIQNFQPDLDNLESEESEFKILRPKFMSIPRPQITPVDDEPRILY